MRVGILSPRPLSPERKEAGCGFRVSAFGLWVCGFRGLGFRVVGAEGFVEGGPALYVRLEATPYKLKPQTLRP